MTLLLGAEYRASDLHLTLINRRGEWVEQWTEPLAVSANEWWRCHPEEYYRTLVAAIERRVREGDLRAGKVCAIGLAADLGVVVLDRELAPIHPRELPWLDFATPVENLADHKELPPRIELVNAFRELPALAPRLRPRIGVVFSVLDYVRYRLCGALSTHVSFAWATGLVEPPAATRWNTDSLIDLGYRIECFPPVFEATVNVGNVNRELVERFGFSPGTKVNAGSDPLAARLLVAVEPAPGTRIALLRGADCGAPSESFRVGESFRLARAPEQWSPAHSPVAPPEIWYERDPVSSHPKPHAGETRWQLPVGEKWLFDFAEPQRPECWPTAIAGDLRIAADAGGPSSGVAIQAGIGLGWWRDLRTVWRKARPPRSYGAWYSSIIPVAAGEIDPGEVAVAGVVEDGVVEDGAAEECGRG